ncbi:DUF3080 family protein [Neptuniibacter marinus]|uniref:DUF3080 family protein n=1 Tax=Neptuniibacter marinus TaxID=1806670 RepID=UPI003B59F113
MPLFRYSYHLLWGTLLTLILTGCERDTPEEMLNNYQYRISNVLKVDQLHVEDTPSRHQFPLRRHLIRPTKEIREGLLDVMNLKECKLLPLIAERNSSLGKVYAPSQKMYYELIFFHALEKCRKKLNTDTQVDQKLLAQVDTIYQIKKENLPSELWNGIFTAKEIELNFSRAKDLLPLLDDGSTQNSINAIKTLTDIIKSPRLDTQWEIPQALNNLESNYKILYNNRSGPKILSSLQLLTAHLMNASQTIEHGLQKKQLCFNNTPSRRARIIQNVFYKYYIGEVQPYLAMVHKYAVEWRSANNQLIDSFNSYNLKPSKQLEIYQRLILSNSQPDSLWAQYIFARDKHTQSWQKLLKQCGMMPTHSD